MPACAAQITLAGFTLTRDDLESLDQESWEALVSAAGDGCGEEEEEPYAFYELLVDGIPLPPPRWRGAARADVVLD